MAAADTELVVSTADHCREFLARRLDQDWTLGVPGMEMSIAEIVAHATEVCLWYAIDLVAAGEDLLTVEHRVKPDQPPTMILKTLSTYSRILARVLGAADDTDRGFHPWGTADPSGFAAMACDELLIHTDDVARAFGVEFVPPDDLVTAVRDRLFPWGAPTGTPWEQLRWLNGRIALDDRDRLTRWRWHCAPLAEWDGTDPTAT